MMPAMIARALSTHALLALAVLAPAAAHAADCPDGMTPVAVAEETVCVDRWEASRADASAQTAGKASDQPPLSRPGVMPWTLIGHAAAGEACALAGKRLCTFEELSGACGGPGGLLFPYGDVYVPGACNGADGGAGQVAKTGSFPGCESPAGALDVSGNVQEWTDSLSPSENTCVFGGDYYAGGLSAEQNKDSESCAPTLFACIAFPDPDTAVFTNLGFRCCAAPGTVVIGPDAGPTDAGGVDAGTPDAGSGGDAAAQDAAGPDGQGADAPDAPDAENSDVAPGLDVGPALLDLVFGGPEDTGASSGSADAGVISARPTSSDGCGGPAPGLWPLLLVARRRGAAAHRRGATGRRPRRPGR